MLESANASDGENLVKMSKQSDYIPEMSESPEQKRAKSGKVNLRKSLTWDSAFFTSEGVLNTEELAIVNSSFRKTETCSLPGIQEELRKSTQSTSTLGSESCTLENLEGDLFNLHASIQMSVGKRGNCLSGDQNASQLGYIVNSTFRKTEACSLPGIQEELRKSTESTSTLGSESCTLENLEGDLFNLRASIQKSVGKRGNCLSGDQNASQLGSRKKVELPSPTRIKPPNTLKIDGVSKQRLECTSKEAVSGEKEATDGSENSKLLLKPPRIVHKPTSLPIVPSIKDSSGIIQIKNNARRTSAGNSANRQGIVAFSKTTGDSRGMTSKSISLPKPTPSHLNTMVFSSKNSLISSSSHSLKSPMENSRKRNALQNSEQSLSGTTTRTPQSLSGTTTRTPIRTSKSKVGPSNFKFSSKASPSSSIDSFVLEGSSSTTTSIKPSNSVESLSSTTSSSPSVVSIDQPCIKKDVSSNRLQSQPTAKASLGTRVLSEPSNKDHAMRSSINSNTGAKSFKPSGLRMPTPKIGYFDAEKNLVSKNPNKFSKIGLRSSLVKGSIGTNDNVAANKPKFSRIPSLRPAAPTQSAALPHTMRPASPAQVRMNSSPVNTQATYRFDKEEISGELSQVGHIANELNSVLDKIQKENMLPAYKTNGLIRRSPSEGQTISGVDIMDEKMSNLSLSETIKLVGD